MSELLNPMTLPLRGSRLIEASAGTGKTWTMAALYLRLVLGHGGPAQGFERALWPAEVLVMTFTKAATRELSDRIRKRLVEAAACFRGERAPEADDVFLSALLADHPEGPPRQAAAWRLAMAAEAMDDAAVFTIDSWCQRMLREHAFDSGCLFDEELQADEAAMLAEAARDYWRQHVYPLGADGLALAMAQWPDMAMLVASVKPLLELPLPAVAGQGELEACIAAARQQRAGAMQALKQGWIEKAVAMQAWLDAQMARQDCAFNKSKLKPAFYSGWLDKLRQWAADPCAEETGLSEAARNRLMPAGLVDAVKPGLAIDMPPCFADFETLMSALSTVPEVGPVLRAHAAARVAERLQQLKAQAGAFGFADMLNRLNVALDEAANGDKAVRLRQRILVQYPVALIDEFQDTSPVQLSIFDRLYRIAEDAPVRALLLIGDPKQSIYGFRGADIQSYLTARRATQGRHHVLGTNHRSTVPLVAAVNHLFQAAERRAGEGAFMFGGAGASPGAGAGADAGDAPGLPFVAVGAQGREETLVSSAGALAPLVLCLDAELRAVGDSRALYAALCAERMVGLLNDPGAGFAQPGQPFARLRPADMAVLVRTGVEAAEVRRALRRRGVASVYLSDKDTVFATEEARDLWRLLQAVAAPRDVRLARAALATALLGLPMEELVVLASDDACFDARCEVLRELGVCWQAQGVLAMVRRALHRFGLPARWLAGGDGERRLTNVLHLAELLQAASVQVDGEQALLRWMSQQLSDAAAGQGGGPGAGDEQVLRLESDADLVKVVTVHKSKGLEYPLVFLPFPAHFRAVVKDARAFAYLPDAQGRRQLELSPTAEQTAAADKERQREDLRLLYVALTRARHSLWVGVAAVKDGKRSACGWHRSAIGYLLSGPETRAPDALARDVMALSAAGAGIEVRSPDLAEGHTLPAVTPLRARGELPALAPAPRYEAHFDRLWSITSYSALVKDATRGTYAGTIDLPPDAPARLLRDDEPADAEGEADAKGLSDAPWHRFPRGAFAGNFLHEQLEWLAGEGFALEASAPLQLALLRRCERQGWGHRGEDVVAWLRRVCSTPLRAVGVALSGLGTALPEMEFWFPSDGLRARAVDALCRQHILPGRARPELPERLLSGMLMGFADLVFEHGGRYGVLDYKSNALGARDGDYTDAAMGAAVLEHRYDVQAVIYLLALHKLLKLRLGRAYAPAEHLHGADYLFLRGVGSPDGGCFHLAPSVSLIEALDALLVPAAAALPGEAS
ncbi:MAG: exodeoxyribonuclease V subunit beta [Rubrivivax sp.]|nr:exodeoxyribonuclease V subunit beta [Rubrivivax sp.]